MFKDAPGRSSLSSGAGSPSRKNEASKGNSGSGSDTKPRRTRINSKPENPKMKPNPKPATTPSSKNLPTISELDKKRQLQTYLPEGVKLPMPANPPNPQNKKLVLLPKRANRDLLKPLKDSTKVKAMAKRAELGIGVPSKKPEILDGSLASSVLDPNKPAKKKVARTELARAFAWRAKQEEERKRLEEAAKDNDSQATNSGDSGDVKIDQNIKAPPKMADMTRFDRKFMRRMHRLIASWNIVVTLWYFWSKVSQDALYEALVGLYAIINVKGSKGKHLLNWLNEFLIIWNFFLFWSSGQNLFVTHGSQVQMFESWMFFKSTWFLIDTWLYVDGLKFRFSSFEIQKNWDMTVQVCQTVIGALALIIDYLQIGFMLFRWHQFKHLKSIRSYKRNARGRRDFAPMIEFRGEVPFHQRKLAYEWILERKRRRVFQKWERASRKQGDDNKELRTRDYATNEDDGFLGYRKYFNIINPNVFLKDEKWHWPRFNSLTKWEMNPIVKEREEVHDGGVDDLEGIADDDWDQTSKDLFVEALQQMKERETGVSPGILLKGQQSKPRWYDRKRLSQVGPAPITTTQAPLGQGQGRTKTKKK